MKYLPILILLLSCQAKAESIQLEHITSDNNKKLNMPFPDAVKVGNMLYLSGQIGNIPGEVKLVEGGIEAETRQAMENIKSVLETNHSSMDQIIKVTVMIADMSEWPKFNKIYAEYFPGKKPARSSFGANGLAIGAAIEIECIALVEE